jgi:uncharacterized protein RhaS with RHS repeats
LLGGFNLYQYAPNGLTWIDPWGWICEAKVKRGAQGQPLSAKATVSRADIGSGTATNLFPSAFARRLGNADDDAGYILAKILGGSGGIDNVFPQLKGINRGQYRAFEKTIKQYIQEYGAVDIKWNFIYGKEGTSPPNRILSFPKVVRMY